MASERTSLKRRNENALKCAKHIMHVSKIQGFSESWYGGEANLAAAYLDLLAENERLRQATAPGASEAR